MEPLSATIILLTQFGVSLINQHRNKETADTIRAEQRKAKEEEIRNRQKRDMERFMRSCQLQEHLESEAHRQRIKAIRQDFMHSIAKIFLQQSLDVYCLNVSPYIIQHSVIPGAEADIEGVRQEPFCILTGSNNADFNAKMLPYLDEHIGSTLSKCWNETSEHTVCYYQNMWKSSAGCFAMENVDGLRKLIPTPTVAVSPILSESGKEFSLLISIWGGDYSNTLQQFEIDTDIHAESLPQNYSKEELASIVERISAYAVCAIGHVVDEFYWSTSYLTPILPELIAKGYINVPDSIKAHYTRLYAQMFNQLILGMLPEGAGDSQIVAKAKSIIEINQYNHPERSLNCLKSICRLTDTSDATGEIIRNQMLSFYRARTDKAARSLAEIDASILGSDTIDQVKTLYALSEQCGKTQISNELSDIVKRYIISWR